MTCRFCHAPLEHLFADLGMSPLSNSYLRAEQLSRMERFYPLAVYVCARCFLVQLPEFESPEAIFGDYAYFSSYSESWLAHAKAYCEAMRARLALDQSSLVIEVASNDGYLLQYFRDAGIPVLGIEPAANVAAVAREQGIETLVQFFGVETARALPRKADLLLGNNVLAHVPDLNDFVAGLKIALAEGGTITMEFPHLLRLIEGNEFDTIYHEHFSYFSLLTVRQVFAAHGLTIVDVEELPTHGGSLRIHARHDLAVDARHDLAVDVRHDLAVDARHADAVHARVDALQARERAFGLDRIESYARFNEQVRATKRALLEFLVAAKNDGKTVAGYGAPAKGNTLLNYCGVRTDFLDYTVDRSPHKQGLFLPGTHIPIFAPERIAETKPDYVLILPWNLRDEIVAQMAHVREWGGKFVVPVPRLEVLA
jgi:SAM-dependent methyltransferase